MKLLNILLAYLFKTRIFQYLCKNLLVLDVLIAALEDKNASMNMEIFLYVYGGMKRDVAKQKRVFELIDQLEAKVRVFNHFNYPLSDSRHSKQHNQLLSRFRRP